MTAKGEIGSNVPQDALKTSVAPAEQPGNRRILFDRLAEPYQATPLAKEAYENLVRGIYTFDRAIGGGVRVVSKRFRRSLANHLDRADPDTLRTFVSERVAPVDYLTEDLYTTREAFFRAAQDMGVYVPANVDLEMMRIMESMNSALLMAGIIDNERKTPHEQAHKNERSSAMSGAMMERAGWQTGIRHYAKFKEDPTLINNLFFCEQQLIREEDEVLAKYAPAFQWFRGGVTDAVNLARHLEALPPLPAREREAVAELREINDSLFAEARDLSRYGVKTAIVPSFLSGDTKEWLVEDPMDLFSQSFELNGQYYELKRSKYAVPFFANFHGSSSRFTTSKVEHTYVTRSDIELTMMYSSVNDQVEDPNAHVFNLQLDHEGNLRSVMGFDVREYFEHMEAGEWEYELMRGDILGIYSDMITPAKYAPMVNQEIRERLRAQSSGKRRVRKPGLTDLLLARRQVLHVLKDEIIADLEHELEEHTMPDPATAVTEKPYKNMITHWVVGHKVPLRPGHRASAEAQKNAAEAGETLGPGETWVKKHPRGNLPNPSLGYIARRRAPSAARAHSQERTKRLMDGHSEEVYRA